MRSAKFAQMWKFYFWCRKIQAVDFNVMKAYGMLPG